jgi:RecA-family ATPase
MKSTDEVETLDELYWRKNNALTANTDESSKAKDWRTKVFDAAGLHSQTFEEVKYVIPNLIPEGVSILAGRPKIGKSWMALDLALTTALKPPSFCLGNLEPLHGDVLYCALEDNPRRLKRRIARSSRLATCLGPNVCTWRMNGEDSTAVALMTCANGPRAFPILCSSSWTRSPASDRNGVA